MSMIDNDWLVPLKKEFSKPYYKDLFEFVKNEYSTTVVYPPADDIFNLSSVYILRLSFPLSPALVLKFLSLWIFHQAQLQQFF